MRNKKQILKEIKLKEKEVIEFHDVFARDYVGNSNIAVLTDKEIELRDHLFANLYDELDALIDELNELGN